MVKKIDQVSLVELVGTMVVANLLICSFSWLVACQGGESPGASLRPDILVDDFEGDSYLNWTVEGEAFGSGPAAGTLPNQMPVTGYYGHRLVNSYFGGDKTTGTITSRPFVIERDYLAFLIGGGGFAEETYIELLVDGKPLRRATGRNTVPGGSEELAWTSWDVRELAGKHAQLRIVDRRTDFWGHINVDHIIQTDRSLSELTAPVRTDVTAKYLLLPVSDRGSPVHCRLKLGEEVLHYFDCQLAATESRTRFWAALDVRQLVGKQLLWELRPASMGELLRQRLRQAEQRLDPPDLYREAFRPQFHFSPRVGWLNDPNGLVYFEGEYHLFFQHNPFGISWGNMTWGHAVSRDLVHWEELDPAIRPDRLGTIFSGSAVVDLANTSGLGGEGRPALCAFYTAAGSHSFEPKPFTQCLAYSLDQGRTWTKYAGNPVLPQLGPDNRDPKVFWHDSSSRWAMVLYVRRDAYSIFSSPNLKDWTWESEVDFPTAYECPELFPLSVDEKPGEHYWVLWSAAGRYLVGNFDGKKFTPVTEVLSGEWGPNAYAAQTWNHLPAGRRVMIAWMRSDGSAYRGMPFNQQLTVPRELSLSQTTNGLRLLAKPVKELERLREPWYSASAVALSSQKVNSLSVKTPELVDMEAVFRDIEAEQLIVDIRGVPIVIRPAEGAIECWGHRASGIKPVRDLDLRVLVDRTSVEIFACRGEYVMTFCRVIPPENRSLIVRAVGGRATLSSLNVYSLKSIWQKE
ncbi:MAG: glycoside hydrolase family 32 protein [Thermoguttaceae bacterium]|nr:glycoside hydrolase family 32 protein [Thermoguttaceae bacterium]MDW8077709.1 glycoside hydrolase family 32 protein [Thermoguttaceae bacterium]